MTQKAKTEWIDPESLALNDYVVVRYAQGGQQLARYAGRRSWDGPYYVYKWRRNGRTWTGEVSVLRSAFLRRATQADIRRFQPAST